MAAMCGSLQGGVHASGLINVTVTAKENCVQFVQSCQYPPPPPLSHGLATSPLQGHVSVVLRCSSVSHAAAQPTCCCPLRAAQQQLHNKQLSHPHSPCKIRAGTYTQLLHPTAVLQQTQREWYCVVSISRCMVSKHIPCIKDTALLLRLQL
jgi:hypothetical protein